MPTVTAFTRAHKPFTYRNVKYSCGNYFSPHRDVNDVKLFAKGGLGEDVLRWVDHMVVRIVDCDVDVVLMVHYQL